jgi:hypothetical protein
MDGDKFRTRAREYITAADVATDPVCKAGLMNLANRWLRLAAEIDGGLCSEASVIAQTSPSLREHDSVS